MKKLFYGLGAIAAVATPVVAVVSCGSNSEVKRIQVTDVASYRAAAVQGLELFRAEVASMTADKASKIATFENNKEIDGDRLHIVLAEDFDKKLEADNVTAFKAVQDILDVLETEMRTDWDATIAFDGNVQNIKTNVVVDTEAVNIQDHLAAANEASPADTSVLVSVAHPSISTFDVDGTADKEALIIDFSAWYQFKSNVGQVLSSKVVEAKGYTAASSLHATMTAAQKTSFLAAIDKAIAAIKALA